MTNRINDFISRGAHAPTFRTLLISTVSSTMRMILNDGPSALSDYYTMCVLFFCVSLCPV